MPPSQKENKIPNTATGKPKAKERASVNFTSPKPIQFPLEANHNSQKNKVRKAATIKSYKNDFGSVLTLQKMKGAPAKNISKVAPLGMILY